MADISFLVDYSQVKAANQEINKVGSAAEKSARVFAAAFKRAEAEQKRSLDTVRQQIAFSQKLEDQRAKEAKLTLDFSRRMQAQKAAEAKAEIALSQKLEAQRAKEAKLTLDFSRRMQAQKAAEAKAEQVAIQNNTQAINRFRSSYDQAYSVQQKTLQLKAMLRQAIANETMTVREAGAELLRYRKALIASNQAQTGFGKSMNRTGVLTQQAGYQVGDFLVQVQSGTNPMVAFGQQATQLVGALYYLPPATLAAKTSILGLSVSFGAMLPIIGIALPLITALGAAWMKSRKANKEATGGISDLEDRLKSLDDTIKDFLITKRAAAAGVTEDELIGGEGIKQAEEDLAKLRAQLENITRTTETAAQSGNIPLRIFNFGAQVVEANMLANATEKVSAAEERLRKIREMAAEEEADYFKEENQTLEDRIAIAKLIVQYGKDSTEVKQEEIAQERKLYEAELRRKITNEALVQSLMESYDTALKLSAENHAMAEAAQEYADIVADLDKEIGEAARKQLQLAGVDITTGISSAAKAAAEMAAQLGISYSRAMDIMTLGSEYLEASVRAGVASGAIPDVALNYLPKTPAQEAMDKVLEDRRNRARKPERKGGGKTPAEVLADNLAKLQETLSVQELLNGKTEAQRKIIQALGSNYKDVDAAILQGLEDKINKQIEYNQEIERQQGLADTVQSAMENGFMSIIDGTTSVKDAFRSMAAEILKELYRVLVVQQMVGSWDQSTRTGSGLVGSIMSAFQADGGVWNKGVQMFANGGVVNGPTAFAHSGGLGVMGEAGPEAIMPLKRGSDGKLGVAGGGNVTVHQTFNFAANGDDSVKRIIAQAAPQIAQMTQKQIMDSRRRGGQMKATFS